MKTYLFDYGYNHYTRARVEPSHHHPKTRVKVRWDKVSRFNNTKVVQRVYSTQELGIDIWEKRLNELVNNKGTI